MSRSRLALHPALPAAVKLRWLPALCRQLIVGAVMVLLVLAIPSTGVAHAEDYVFSIGVLVKVDRGAITLGFDDGTRETYRIGPETTIRGQNADERTLADLELGNPILIITAEGQPTAVSVVDGGPTGFQQEAGPADIRGHEGACFGSVAQSAERCQT